MKKANLMLNLFIAICLVLGALVTIPVTPAYASTLTVNTLADENDGSCVDSDCSLRDAIAVAISGDTINFNVTGTITLSSLLDVQKNLTITGPGSASLTLDGNNATRIFNIGLNQTVEISGLTLTNGKPAADELCGGGAIHTTGFLTLDDMVITNNDASLADDPMWCLYPRGGGIKVWQNGSLTITNSRISDNKSYWNGGGIFFESPNGTLSLTNVTISGNTAINSDGGGLIVVQANAAVTANRVTISGNTAYQFSGGMSINGYSDNKVINITNSTITGNSANVGASQGGLYIGGSGGGDPTVNLNNSTIAGNNGYGIYTTSTAPVNVSNTILEDCSGTLTSQGYNLIQNTTGCTIAGDTTGNITGQDPMLVALADNGGFTETMALATESPAVDTGNDATCISLDQREVARPQRNHCDMGAYELEPDVMTIRSSDINDGWILESTEASNGGGTMNKNASLLRLGDDAANKQYRAILSFDTATLPENAIITSVTLKLKYAGLSGTNPFTTHGKLLADICEGAFKSNLVLELGDFKPLCSKNKVLIYSNNKVDNWYSQALLSEDFQFVNLEGVTQFRLRFTKDDNNDFGADFLKLFSGNAAEADRPQLVIEYYVQ
jgi:CSLREA domain-containing protein